MPLRGTFKGAQHTQTHAQRQKDKGKEKPLASPGEHGVFGSGRRIKVDEKEIRKRADGFCVIV